MWRGVFVVCVLAVVAAAPSSFADGPKPPAQPAPPLGPAPVAPKAVPAPNPLAEPQRQAVERATAYLLKQIETDGLPLSPSVRKGHGGESLRLGTAAFGLYALASANIATQQRPIDRGLRLLAQRIHKLEQPSVGTIRFVGTYAVSSYLLAMYTRYVGPVWRTDLVAHKKSFPAWARGSIRRCLSWLALARRKDGSMGYPGPGSNLASYENLSCQQFATLAELAFLGFCSKTPRVDRMVASILTHQQAGGLTMPRSIFRLGDEPAPAPAPASRPQDEGRGFTYYAPPLAAAPSRGMTAAGVAALVRCKVAVRHIAGAWSDHTDFAIYDGFAWLVQNFEKREPISVPVGDYYRYSYLYALSIACRMADVTWLGSHDWFAEHAQKLIREQRADGHWPGATLGELSQTTYGMQDQEEFLHTCFAILFLEQDRNPSAVAAKPLLKVPSRPE